MPKALTITHPMHYIGSQIFWPCVRTRCLSICAPSFVAVVRCKWALRVITFWSRNTPQTISRNLNFQKFLSYILLFKCGVPSELKCSVGNRTWEVVGSKDTCPHKKGRLSGITVGCLIWPSAQNPYQWTYMDNYPYFHSLPNDCISIDSEIK